MRWQADVRPLVRTLVWTVLVLAVAANGAIVVHNVTEALVGIATHQPSMVVVQQPTR
jgi:hypothetical protein